MHETNTRMARALRLSSMEEVIGSVERTICVEHLSCSIKSKSTVKCVKVYRSLTRLVQTIRIPRACFNSLGDALPSS